MWVEGLAQRQISTIKHARHPQLSAPIQLDNKTQSLRSKDLPSAINHSSKFVVKAGRSILIGIRVVCRIKLNLHL